MRLEVGLTILLDPPLQLQGKVWYIGLANRHIPYLWLMPGWWDSTGKYKTLCLLRGWDVRLKLLAVTSLQPGSSLSKNKAIAETSRAEWPRWANETWWHHSASGSGHRRRQLTPFFLHPLLPQTLSYMSQWTTCLFLKSIWVYFACNPITVNRYITWPWASHSQSLWGSGHA